LRIKGYWFYEKNARIIGGYRYNFEIVTAIIGGIKGVSLFEKLEKKI